MNKNCKKRIDKKIYKTQSLQKKKNEKKLK